jgi:glycosyltransferase involved in cell wall biosynthesis
MNTSGRPRLAIISTMGGSPWGASEDLWHAVATRALEHGWDVMASVHPWEYLPDPLVSLRSAGARVLPRRPRSLAGRAFPRLARNLRPTLAEIAASKPDVVLLNHGATYDLSLQVDIARDIARLRRSGCPVLALCHGADDANPPSTGQRIAARNALTNLDEVRFTCAAHLMQTQRHLGTDLPNAGLFQNPLNVDEAFPWPGVTKLELACVGRLSVAEKGQDLLIEALSQTTWSTDEWHLTFYGEGPDGDYLRELVSYYGLSEKVAFGGHQSPGAIWPASHALVLPSRREGMPLTVLEAMTAGRPVLATDVSGIHEVVTDDVDGFLAGGPTTRALTLALERLWERRDGLASMGRRASEHVAAWRANDPVGDILAAVSRLASVPTPT